MNQHIPTLMEIMGISNDAPPAAAAPSRAKDEPEADLGVPVGDRVSVGCRRRAGGRRYEGYQSQKDHDTAPGPADQFGAGPGKIPSLAF